MPTKAGTEKAVQGAGDRQLNDQLTRVHERIDGLVKSNSETKERLAEIYALTKVAAEKGTGTEHQLRLLNGKVADHFKEDATQFSAIHVKLAEWTGGRKLGTWAIGVVLIILSLVVHYLQFLAQGN